MKVETRARLRFFRMSPQKARLLIDVIRGLPAARAIGELALSKKHAARPVLKLLKSAIANAVHNDDADERTLVVKRAFVDGGPILYRWMPRAHGRATPIRKRTSHMTIILEGDTKEGGKKMGEKQEMKKQETGAKEIEKQEIETHE